MLKTIAVLLLFFVCSSFIQTPSGPPPKTTPGASTEPSAATQKAEIAKNKKAAKKRAVVAVPVATPSPTACRSVEEKVAEPEVVLCITHLEKATKDTNVNRQISMEDFIQRGDNITVPIVGLKEWVNADHKDHDPHALRLYLAGHLLPKDEPSLIELDQGYINFQLTTLSPGNDANEKEAWILIFTEARRRGSNPRLPITIGLPHDLQPFASGSFIGVLIYPIYMPYVVTGLFVLLISLLLLGYFSNLLRDTSEGVPTTGRAPFSLGKMQMAWWFYWVIAAYVYISLITKEVNILTTTALTLIGISAGTGLAAVFVDKQKVTAAENQKVALQSERGVVTARIALLEGTKPSPGTPEALELHDRQKRLAEINELLNKFPAVKVAPSSKGLIDVLRDGEGLSFHRFQIAVWTMVLGLVFIKSAFLDLVMPEFDTTLLGLMGISSGTYIGFKFPEK